MSGIDRTEILRRDCASCHGNGYQSNQTGEEACNDCGGTGLHEIEVPFKFDGDRSPSEVDDLFKNTQRLTS